MATAAPIKKDEPKLQISRGTLDFDPFDVDEQRTGEINMGHSIITYQAESESVEERSAETRESEIIGSEELNITRTINVECKHLSDENYRRFLAATTEEVTQAATPVTGELRVVKQGRTYQLGQTDDNPEGVRNVTAVTVKSEDGEDTYTAGIDYNFDSPSGRIQIIDGGSIANDSTVQFGYTPVAGTYRRWISGESLSFLAAVRFTPDNAKGDNRPLYFPKCSISPTGELPLANTDTQYVSVGFAIKVLKPANGPAVISRSALQTT